jgi:signal peptidase I
VGQSVSAQSRLWAKSVVIMAAAMAALALGGPPPTPAPLTPGPQPLTPVPQLVAPAPQLVRMNGQGMVPTLKDAQSVVVDRAAYRNGLPQRGDIIVFRPAGTSAPAEFIFRVIALPGDRIRIADGAVWVNGRRLSEPYVKEPWTVGTTWPANGREVATPADQYFVLGDNRDGAKDSRNFGFVSRSWIVGKVSG